MRRLNIDLAGLSAAVNKMGADQVPFEVDRERTPVPKIDIDLGIGIEVGPEEIDTKDGLLSYKNRQVLVYIQDHGYRIDSVLADGVEGNRFHLADCWKLKEMREKGRFERYVVTHDISGKFYVSGQSKTGEQNSGNVELRVCQFCLRKLNYSGARKNDAKSIAKSFNIENFFAEYSSFFSHMPSRHAGKTAEDGYTDDWTRIASNFKSNKSFRCDACRVDLTNHRQLLHVHHKNGVKSDNRSSNLEALCAACHRKQANHGHMFVSHKNMQTINRLRHEQHLMRDTDWHAAFKFCDPGLHGVLHALKTNRRSIPEIGYDIKNDRSEVVATLEIAWPRARKGIAIAEADRNEAEKAGWRVQSMTEALDHMS